jgi:hypothetical protein
LWLGTGALDLGRIGNGLVGDLGHGLSRWIAREQAARLATD